MSNEFEPYHTENKNNEFSVWDYRGSKDDELIEVNQEEEFLKQCEIIKQEAFEKGYADGLDQGQAEIDAQKEELKQWLEFIQNPIKLLDDQLIDEMLQTLIWLSQYCIGVELSANPDKLRQLFDEIKKELPSLRGNKILGMHPDDVAWLKAKIDDKEMPGIENALFADSNLNRGDFYFQDEHRELDGRISTRFITLFAKYIKKENLISSIKLQD